MTRVKVGDKLFIPDEYRNNIGRTYTVAKVGRVWATMEERWGPRVNVATMRTDGNRQLQVYESESAWKAETELGKSWRDLVSDLGRLYSRPKHIGHEQIAMIRQAVWPSGGKR